VIAANAGHVCRWELAATRARSTRTPTPLPFVLKTSYISRYPGHKALQHYESLTWPPQPNVPVAR